MGFKPKIPLWVSYGYFQREHIGTFKSMKGISPTFGFVGFCYRGLHCTL